MRRSARVYPRPGGALTFELPVSFRSAVEAALAGETGRAARIVRADAVRGGCITPTARVTTGAGDVAFLKWMEPGRGVPGMLAAEAVSLEALARTGALRVPRVIGVADVGGPYAGGDREGARGPDEAPAARWLLLDWLEPGRATAGSWERLGRGLARLHATRAARFGWPADNFIGPLPQANRWLDDWPSFWRARRLEPQLRRACDGGWLGPDERRRFDRLLDGLDASLGDLAEDGASLLHGDLWRGNVHIVADGEPAVIDPSSYYGHREVDLAMAELFGGFDAAFFRAYDEAWPVDEAYRRVRRPIYQLYYLLVHVNLFGGEYVAHALDALARAEAGG